MNEKVKKWKASLNVDGLRMVKGVNYNETYAPVALWNSLCLLLTLTVLNKRHTQRIDYFLAFPQAPLEKEYI